MATIYPYSGDFQKAVSRQRQKGGARVNKWQKGRNILKSCYWRKRPCRSMRGCKDPEQEKCGGGDEDKIGRPSTGMLLFSVICIQGGCRSLSYDQQGYV